MQLSVLHRSKKIECYKKTMDLAWDGDTLRVISGV
jgi:hypothetical protein